MPKPLFLKGTITLQQKILAQTRGKMTKIIEAPKGGYRIFRNIVNAPSAEESLAKLHRLGHLSRAVPPFLRLDGITTAHTFRVCESTQHFVQGDFNWFYGQLAVKNVDRAIYVGTFTTIHNVFQKLSPNRQKLMFYIALNHDIGKAIDAPPFHFHPELSSILAQQIFSQWGFSNARINFAIPVIQQHTLIGSLISGQACPTTVLRQLKDLSPRSSLQEAFFAAILTLNILDVSGWGTRGLQYGLLSRYQAIADLSQYPRLEQGFYLRRLQVLSRSYEENVIQRKEKGSAYEEVLAYLDELVPKEEFGHFKEGLNKAIIFHGLTRVMAYLRPKNKVKLLRTLAQLRLLFIQESPELYHKSFHVISSDALGQLSEKNPNFEKRINDIFDQQPDVFSASNLRKHLEATNAENLFGLPFRYDQDAVYLDFSHLGKM